MQAIEEALDKVVKLLAYVSDKDLFAEFYRKRLSKRLLQDRSASDDLERSVLSRLKQQCGAQFTSKVGSGRCFSCVNVNMRLAVAKLTAACCHTSSSSSPARRVSCCFEFSAVLSCV